MDYIAINQAVAYAGSYGKTRRTFCEDYIEFKRNKIIEINNYLARDIKSKQLTASCSRGCSHCCSQFIVVSLQEAECIVYHLYKTEIVKQRFIASYPVWLERVREIEKVFLELIRLCQVINTGKAARKVFEDLNAASDKYAHNHNPCPFLVDNSCSIYEVRPFVCANYLSVTPPEWCQPGSPQHKQSIHVKVKVLGKDMAYFLQLTRNRVLHPMPVLVHSILKGGYGALASFTGQPDLKHKVLCDPEIRAVLQRALTSK